MKKMVSFILLSCLLRELCALLAADDIKKLVTVWVKHLCVPERSIRNMVWLIGFGVTLSEISIF